MNTCYFDFEIEREFKCAPSVLFRAWSDPKAKAKWFRGPIQWVETGRSLDLREGGSETMSGVFGGKPEPKPAGSASECGAETASGVSDGALSTDYAAHYYDVQPGSRIGFAFEVRLGGEIYSISTAVVEFTETHSGTMMTYHEQLAVFMTEGLSGVAMSVEEARSNRIIGTQAHFDRLEGFLNS